jgi:hypothetical protein
MSLERALFVRKGLVGGGAFFALILLASFYSVVSGAVDRAARQHLLASQGAPQVVLGAPVRPAARARSLLARVDN